MKTCCACKKTLDFDSFNKSSSNKDGVQTWCRDCQKQKYSEYRKTATDKQSARWKRYYYKNREKMIQRTRDYEKSLPREVYVENYKRRNKNARFRIYGIT